MLFRIMALVACFMAPVAQAETRVPTSQLEIQLGFAPLVKEAAPAVVNIYAKRVVETRQSPFQGDPFFQNLFRDFDVRRQSLPADQRVSGIHPTADHRDLTEQCQCNRSRPRGARLRRSSRL